MSDGTAIAGVAVVGCGYWGRNLVRSFSELGALRAVVDADARTATTLGAQFGVPALDLQAALELDGVKAIATASPAFLHRDIAVRALHAGKHVFVEKPIALSVAEGEEMRDVANAAGRVLMVGHLLQYHPAYRRLRAVIEEGGIGRLRYVYSNRLSMGKLRTEEDVVWSFAPHDISMILGLTGEEPSEVIVRANPIVSQILADSAHLHLAFPSGVNAHVFTSWLHPIKEQRLVAIGEMGCVVFDDTKPWAEKLVRTDYALVDGPALQKGAVEAIPVEEGEPLKLECAHFLEAIATGRRPLTDADEALAVLRVMSAADQGLVRTIAA